MNEITRARLMADLKQDEGKRAQPYLDTLGHWTVGYGHNLEARPLSDAAMQQILEDDMAGAEADCRRLPWFDGLDDVRQAVIVNMAFNLGLAGLAGFRKMIAALIEGRYAEAAAEMLDSRYARQVGARAKRLAEMMRTGGWP